MFQQLQWDDGTWVTWGNGLEDEVQNFYTELFRSQGSMIDTILELIQPRIPPDKQFDLSRSFDEDDVKLDIF